VRAGSASSGSGSTAAQLDPVPLGPLPAGVRPTHEWLLLDIDPEADHLHGTADIALHLDHPREHFWLHGRGLAVSSATITVPATIVPSATITPPATIAPAAITPSATTTLPSAPSSTPATATLDARWEEVDPTGVARVTVPRAVAGDITLHVVFDAAYDAQLVGAYKVNTASGAAVFSKFEAIYARRAFPCFDEPSFKLPFDIAITAPSADAVIGNMPVAEASPVDTAHTRVRFATTPPLPSYLVAFAVGKFDTRGVTLAAGARRPTALPIGAVALRGRGEDTAYALAEESALLAEQERYFDLAFPFPKLDLVAVPDFQSGAMENAGAITFRDSLLLVNDKITSFDRRIAVTDVLAHETAHQWFGDLVTMRWWDDLWLNEGFATFLATRTLRAVRPDFEMELHAAARASSVMSVDGLASARRIRQPIDTTHDITNAFDGITYDKGAAVLAMVEHFIGDEPFRRGLHAYLVGHAAGNATTDDLVRELSNAAGKELGPLVGSFIDQPGVPVVVAHSRCEAGRGSVDLAQSRWRAAGSTVPVGGSWTIPVCIRAGIGKRVEDVCTLLGAPTGSVALPGCAAWIMPNAQGAGYYHSALALDDLARLRDHGRLAVVERVTLAHDLEAAFRSAGLPGGDVLRALEPIARDPHGAVALIPLELFAFVDANIVDGKQRATLRARIRKLYAGAVASLGWTPAAGERPWRRLFRSGLFQFLALGIDDHALLAEASRRGQELLGLGRDHVRHPDAAAPDLTDLVVAAAVRNAGAPVFDALVAELESSQDAQIRQRDMAALAATRDPVLVGRALDLSLDPRLRQNERFNTLQVLLVANETRDVAWSWLQAHFDALVALLPDRFAGRLPSMISMCDRRRMAEVEAFFTPRVEQLTGGPRNLAQALEAAAQCEARVAAQRDSVEAYLR
jgi:alanyl aminopeptidase